MSNPTAGLMLTLLLAFVFVVALLLWNDSDPAQIANVAVPSGLRCAEDEVIWWTGIDTLGCVHWENVP